MKLQEGTFQNYQGQEIFYQGWLPAEAARGVILVVHGLHEHSGRYQTLAGFFAKQGYAVYAPDFPGHGKSAGTRSYVENFDVFTLTLEDFLGRVRSWHPDLPIYLLGHSLGGLISLIYLLDHQEQIRGAVISGSLTKVPDYVSDFTIRLGKLLSELLPKVRILGIDIDGISRDPEVVQAYRDDPLVFTGKMTARISDVLNSGIERLADQGSRISTPLLILHGGEDRICDPAWSEYLLNLVSSSDKELIIYPGLYHEVYNEPEKEQVFKDVLRWIETRTP